MTLLQYVYIYLATVPVFFIIDMLWIGFIAKDFYAKQIGSLLGPINWSAAIIFYLLYIIAIIVFAVAPALAQKSFITALTLGAFFGFIAYATYDLTNLATLKNWPLTVTLVDMLWGTVLTGAVASISYFIASKFIV